MILRTLTTVIFDGVLVTCCVYTPLENIIITTNDKRINYFHVTILDISLVTAYKNKLANNSLVRRRGSNPKKVGFLDWIWMGNPKPKKNPKIQKIQNPNPNPNPKIHFFLDFKKSKFEENDFF